MILDLYRQKTQIRLRIYNIDTGKLEKCYVLEYIIILFLVPSESHIIEICLIVLFSPEIIPINKEYFVA